MANYDIRRPNFDLSGSLAARVAPGDQSITCQGSAPGVSNVFAALPTDYSSTLYLPLTIANDITGKSEIVWVTGHASGSAVLSVVRQREGTSLQSFEVGDTVRCSPTIRDVDGLIVASRAALPADPHIGMRALVRNALAFTDGTYRDMVLEKAASGWVSSALGSDPAFKHYWVQGGYNPSGTPTNVVWGNQSGTTGKIASTSNGAVLLNQPGKWALTFTNYGSGTANRNQGMDMKWPGGAFPGLDTLYDYRGVLGNAGGSGGVGGNGLAVVSLTVDVTAAQAAQPISMSINASVSLSGGMNGGLLAEYLGG